MTSNPGDEKVIQDDMHFKGEVSHRQVDGELLARPGQLQETLNKAQSEGIGSVGLAPDETYDPGSPTEVPGSVTLFCNGATIEPTGDYDIFHIAKEARIVNPQIDYQGLDTYTSTIFKFPTSKFGRYSRGMRTYVDGGHTQGNEGGTVFEFNASDDTISLTRSRHNTRDVDTVLECYAAGPTSDGNHANGHVLEGVHESHRIGLYCHSDRGDYGGSSGNVLTGMIQPNGNLSENCLRAEEGNNNIVRGYVWDAGRYTDVLYCGSNSGGQNKVISQGAGATSSIVDNGGNATNGIFSTADALISRKTNFGIGSKISANPSASHQTIVGREAETTDERCLAMGTFATANMYDTVVGYFAQSDGDRNTLLGANSGGTGRNAVGLGMSTTVDGADSVAAGRGASTSATAAISLGRGESNSVPETCSIRGNVKYSRSFVDSANSTAYTTTTADEVVGVDTGSAAVTVTLDSTSAGDEGHKITVKDEGGNAGTNNITVDTAGTETIDGATSTTISSNYGTVTVYSDGANWFTK